jgi:hypothetical protein
MKIQKKVVIHYLSKIKREVKLQRCWSEGVLSLTLSSCRKPEKLIWRKYIRTKYFFRPKIHSLLINYVVLHIRHTK